MERVEAALQERFVGTNTKSVCIAFNAELYLNQLKKKLEELNIVVTKRGYIYESYIERDAIQAVFGDDATLERRREPDPKTLSNGMIVKAENIKLVWSNYSLKLKICFNVMTETIQLRDM